MTLYVSQEDLEQEIEEVVGGRWGGQQPVKGKNGRADPWYPKPGLLHVPKRRSAQSTGRTLARQWPKDHRYLSVTNREM